MSHTRQDFHNVLPGTPGPRRRHNRRRPAARRGTVIGLMAFLLPVLAILAAFCINAAHMQLAKTELMVATDAAARAGGRAFSEMQTVEAAKEAAVITAALNDVNGQPLLVRDDDAAGEIEFGMTTQPNGFHGRYQFQVIPTALVASGQEVASALRVNGRRDNGSLAGPVPLILPGLLARSTFEPVQESVAMQVDRDISLVLDRSGSMEWITFHWPSGVSPWTWAAVNAGVDAGLVVNIDGTYYYAPGVDQYEYQQWAWEHYHELGPAPLRPWEELLLAVDAFLQVLEATPQDEQVSIASYATDATLDCWLQTDYGVVRDTLNGLNTGGMTAIGQGMQQGIQALLDSAARPYASKTMVVMTDGNHNRGINPLDVTHQLMSQYNLTIHTVTFGGSVNTTLMQQVAAAGGGNHYHAADGEQLIQVFEEIANNLPTILVE